MYTLIFQLEAIAFLYNYFRIYRLRVRFRFRIGFSATNDIFAKNAWYFRNALVRANYTNLQKGIHETTEYLEAISQQKRQSISIDFLRSLVLLKFLEEVQLWSFLN